MTADDTDRWRELFGKLCVTYDRTWDEAQSRFYFDALRDLPFPDLEVAALILVQELKYFPRPAEWREAAANQRSARVRARASEVQALSRRGVHCEVCGDTGWSSRGCREGDSCKGAIHATTGEPVCRRDGDHTYVERCACRSTNPLYQARQAAGALGHGDGVSSTPQYTPRTGGAPMSTRELAKTVTTFPRKDDE